MKIVRIFGGLGNQMFQYCLYKKLDTIFNDVKLDMNDFETCKYHNGFELKKIFNIEPKIATNREINKLAFNKQAFITRFIRKTIKVELRKRTEYRDKNNQYDKAVFQLADNIYYDGYWQNENYFKDIDEIIRSEFKFKNKLDDKNKDIKKKISATNSVSVHIRRGDYINNSKLGNVCNIEYYNMAIKMMLNIIEEPNFFIFSDDIEWCKENISIGTKIHYIDNNYGEDSYKDMQLMSLCKHNIIANSTFSWWGAWLNTNKGKVVICPKLWNNNSSENNVVSEEWIKI